MKTEIKEDGKVIVTRGDSQAQWCCNSPEQAAKHIATWRDGQRDGAPSEVIETGDVSAIMDCHADALRQVESEGRYTPTASWIYKNDGNVVQVIGVADSMDTPVPADAPTPDELAREPSLLGKLWRFFGFTE